MVLLILDTILCYCAVYYIGQEERNVGDRLRSGCSLPYCHTCSANSSLTYRSQSHKPCLPEGKHETEILIHLLMYIFGAGASLNGGMGAGGGNNASSASKLCLGNHTS